MTVESIHIAIAKAILSGCSDNDILHTICHSIHCCSSLVYLGDEGQQQCRGSATKSLFMIRSVFTICVDWFHI